MRILRAFLSRLAGTFRDTRAGNEFDAELESHLAMQAEDNRRAGMEEDEARRQAILKMDGVAAVKEAYRDQQRLSWLDVFSRDLRYALRTLLANPRFSVVAIGTLAIGIGTATSMFSVVRAVMMRPLPYAEPGQLVRVTETNPLKRWTSSPAAPANYADWRRMNTVFDGMACYLRSNDSFSISGFSEPQRLRGISVSGNLFDVLQVKPMMGRTFKEEESYEGKDRVVILSYELWKNQFGGDVGILGRKISLSEKSYEVIGVMPPGFFFPNREAQLWKGLGLKESWFTEHRRPHYLMVIARLKQSVTLERAAEEMKGIAAKLERMYPENNTQMSVRLDGFHEAMFEKEKLPLLILMSAVGVLFLIICSNLTNLQLGRTAARSREFGIREALGASKARLAMQLMTECLLLSLTGGLLGLAIAAGAPYVITRIGRAVIPGFAEVRIDVPVMLFAIAVTLLAPMLFGLTPALRPSQTLSTQDRGGISLRRNRGVRVVLVASQVALSVVLVAGSALLMETLIRLQAVDPGFVADRAASFSITLPNARYKKDEEMIRAVVQIEEELRKQPGVEAAGASLVLPLGGAAWSSDATPEGRPAGEYERELQFNCISPGYLQAAGIRLLNGRNFNAFDKEKSEPVALVNQALQRAYFRGESVVGKRIKFGRPQDKDPWTLIVGLVADTKQDGMGSPVRPQAYLAFAQQPNDYVSFVIRGTGISARNVRAALNVVDPAVPDNDFGPFQQLVQDSVRTQRFRAYLLTGFAAIALFLAGLGVYGVLAYAMSQRAKEMGVRLALGAQPLRLFGFVVKDGMYPVMAGSAIGWAVAMFATRLLQSLLFGVTPGDPMIHAITIGIILAVALLACSFPAMKAIRVDPLVSLREQ